MQVVTAQYFAWYLSLLPLALPWLEVSLTVLQLLQNACGHLCQVRDSYHEQVLNVAAQIGKVLPAAGVWVAAQLHWLFWAYLLEIEGRPVYLCVWLASVLFFCANVLLICQLIRAVKLQTKPAAAHSFVYAEGKGDNHNALQTQK